jgi:hypothetical protein
MNLDADGALGALGLTLKNLAAGAVSSFVALRFFDGLSTLDKWTTFLGGWAIAAWGGAPVTTYLEQGPKVEVGIVLLLGLFGMSIAGQLMRVIRDTDWKGLLDAILRRRGGGAGGQ